MPMSTKKSYKIKSLGYTNVGRKRERNEDFYSIIESEELYVLADGMGGHTSGQIASRIASEGVIDFITRISREESFTFDPLTPDYFSHAEKLVYAGIIHANKKLFQLSRDNPGLRGMGTTLVVMLGTNDSFVIGYVGDSRVYRVRNGEIEQVTEDHSLMVHLIKTGQLTETSAKSFKGKNIILKAVGLKPDTEPDVFTVAKRTGDLYMSCSDGLSDLVQDHELRHLLADNGLSMYQKATSLINQANGYGGKDNITVILLSIQDFMDDFMDESEGGDGDEEFDDIDTNKIPTVTTKVDTAEVDPLDAYASGKPAKKSTARIRIPQEVLEAEQMLKNR